MTLTYTVIWAIAFAVFVVFELITSGLTTIWFAIGSIFAIVASHFGYSPVAQIFIFLIVSTLLLLLTRPLIVKYMNNKSGVEKTNVEAVIGKRGIVVNSISEFEAGIVKLDGHSWTAVSENPDVEIQSGEEVVVSSVSGVKLIVNKVD